MRYVVDIDGTICTQREKGDYENAEPLPERIEKINKLYDEGHTIWFFTARGSETGINWRELTEKQLKDWGVKYHRLLFGKPSADRYIDDKAVNANEKEW